MRYPGLSVREEIVGGEGSRCEDVGFGWGLEEGCGCCGRDLREGVSIVEGLVWGVGSSVVDLEGWTGGCVGYSYPLCCRAVV